MLELTKHSIRNLLFIWKTQALDFVCTHGITHAGYFL